MEKTIIVRFQGGLGNQLYEYAFYKWLSQKYKDVNILADISDYKVARPHESLCLWEIFPNVSISKAGIADIFRTTGEIPIFYGGPLKNKANFIRQAINRRFFNRKETYYKNVNDTVTVEEVERAIESGKTYLDSYWQNSAFWEDTKSWIRKDLVFKNEELDSFEIRDNYVAVHVRRGDYVGTYLEKEVGIEYYKKAVELLQKRIPDACFCFFSDDQDYVEQAFNWVNNKIVMSKNANKSSYRDMECMSKFKYMIVSNSTFSIWAAYLNDACNLVVYPNVSFLRTKNLQEWIGL